MSTRRQKDDDILYTLAWIAGKVRYEIDYPSGHLYEKFLDYVIEFNDRAEVKANGIHLSEPSRRAFISRLNAMPLLEHRHVIRVKDGRPYRVNMYRLKPLEPSRFEQALKTIARVFKCVKLQVSRIIRIR